MESSQNICSIGPETTELTFPIYLFLDLVTISVYDSIWLELYLFIRINIGCSGCHCRRFRGVIKWNKPNEETPYVSTIQYYRHFATLFWPPHRPWAQAARALAGGSASPLPPCRPRPPSCRAGERRAHCAVDSPLPLLLQSIRRGGARPVLSLSLSSPPPLESLAIAKPVLRTSHSLSSPPPPPAAPATHSSSRRSRRGRKRRRGRGRGKGRGWGTVKERSGGPERVSLSKLRVHHAQQVKISHSGRNK